MSSKNERICRLCLKATKNEFRELNGVVKQIFGVLLLKLDLDITRDPIICEDCNEVAKKCLDFKSTCINTEEIVVLFSADKEKTSHSIRDIYGEKEQLLAFIDKHLDICRFCLTRLERNNFVLLDSLMSKTMVEMLLEYMPETDLNVIENPIICTNCRENLDSYFMFVTCCLDTESKIKAYCKKVGTDSTGEVTLGNVLHFLSGYILQNPKEFYQTFTKIKQEQNMFKDVDLVRYEPQRELIKLEEPVIKEEELMKLEEELDIKEEEISWKESLSEITNPGISFLRTSEDKTEEHSHQKQGQVKVEDISCRAVFTAERLESIDTRIDKRIVCTDETQLKIEGKQKKGDSRSNSDASEKSLCKYTLRSSKQGCVLKTHIRICEGNYDKQKNKHENISKKGISLFSHGVIKKSSTKKHILVHMDPSHVEMHKCPLCDFEGKRKKYITAHMKVHKNVSEINMHKCSLCSFQTKYKGSLKRHMSIHTDISEMKMLKCSLCTYETKLKHSLQMHMLTHRDISEIKMYKCSLCTFETKYKGSLKQHTLMHRDISEIEMYNCALCAHKSKTKTKLKLHMSVHKDISEVKIYKCSLCIFGTKHKSALKGHMLMHTDISEIKIYKCSLCIFGTKRKSALRSHMLIHRDISEIKMYKCSLCTFETKHKGSLKNHTLIHSDISKIEMYNCALCAYKSKVKDGLKQHMFVHKDISEIKMYKCSLCIYGTKYRSAIRNHMLIHTDISEIKMYKCSLCTFETKHKGNLKKHMLIHRDISEIEMYKCALCAYQCKRKSNLKKHIMSVHKNT